MLDANSPIILIKPLLPWGLKGGNDFATALTLREGPVGSADEKMIGSAEVGAIGGLRTFNTSS